MTWRLWYLLIGLHATALAASAQVPQGALTPPKPKSAIDVSYDGRYRFARLSYTGEGCLTDEGPGWNHDYPAAELNLMRMMASLTTLVPRTDSGAIVSPADPQLMKYPVAYLSEPACWVPTDAEVAGLQRYLARGGMVIFDDFLDVGSLLGFGGSGGVGAGALVGLSEQIRRVLPGARLIPIRQSDPVFKIFYDAGRGDLAGPITEQTEFWGIYAGNDPSKRLLMIINYNADIGEGWQWSSGAVLSSAQTSQSFKFGVNYILYGIIY